MNLMLLSSGPGVYYAYQNSDSVGKAVVVILLLGSILTWTLMIEKYISLHRASVLSSRFLSFFKSSSGNLASPGLIREGLSNPGPLASIYSAGVEKLQEFYQAGNNIVPGMHGITPCKLSDAQYNAIEAVLEREVSSQTQDLETHVNILATLVSLSPFCGLFGTVWGVMMAFCGIAVAGKPDFTALAPGVAGALLTTVAGLIVAIPSLVGYNFVTAKIRNLTVAMDNFTEEFMVRVKLEQLEIDRKHQEM